MGKREGLCGARSGLFFEIPRLADEFNVTFVFLENVPDQCSNRLDKVVDALHDRGFDCRWRCLSASELGAPHERNRFFLLAKRRDGTGSGRMKLQLVAEVTQAARRFGWHAEKGHPARARSRLIIAAECPRHKERNFSIGKALTSFQARAAFMYLVHGGGCCKRTSGSISSKRGNLRGRASRVHCVPLVLASAQRGSGHAETVVCF